MAEVVSKVLDLDSLDDRSEERICNPEVVEFTKTLQLFYDNTNKLVRILLALTEEEKEDLVQ